VIGAIPFLLVERISVTQAVFESVSGWTTTGLSVIDVTQTSKMVLLLRSTLQLVGGAGFAIIMVATLIGPTGSSVSGAEGRTEQLVPHVRESARIVLMLYLGYTVVGIVAYVLAGMHLFDAVNHAFAAVSTGGFSTRADSIGYWNSTAVEAVTLPLMLLGNMNFLTAYLILKGRLRAAARSGELRLMAILTPISILLVLLLVCQGLYTPLAKAVRVSIFETVSALTTTGFSTVPYGQWNALGILVLVLLMVIGGGVCSTAGGLKQYRVFLLAKALVWEIRRALLPRDAVVDEHVWRGEQRCSVGDGHIREVAVFSCFYLAALGVGTLILAAHGYRLDEALFEYASAQGTVGLSVGVTSATAPPMVLWTEILGMFFGRLEFLVIFIGAARIIRDLPVLLRRPDVVDRLELSAASSTRSPPWKS
jgi:trk system potassium uptake protein TrkH